MVTILNCTNFIILICQVKGGSYLSDRILILVAELLFLVNGMYYVTA
jgi:hypothetical protein